MLVSGHMFMCMVITIRIKNEESELGPLSG